MFSSPVRIDNSSINMNNININSMILIPVVYYNNSTLLIPPNTVLYININNDSTLLIL